MSQPNFHCKVALRGLEKAGNGGKGSGVATQTGSGRLLSPEGMNKLKV